MGIYCLNATHYLTGKEPIAISANLFSTPNDPRFREVEKSVTFQLQYPSGVLAICSTHYVYYHSRRFRVFGSDAWAQLDPAFDYNGLQMTIGRRSPSNGMAENITQVRMNEKNQFALEIDDMADCVIHNRVPHTPGEEGLQNQKLIELIYKAAQTVKLLRYRLLLV